ncbi:atrial natriuretic peptide receptor 1-like [Paramacrobiotus metropolitanus]|uniref:atrial natriuretic peptide receptor 1-like n=1 Tax=Paramacrobiotus metropolitanus TaxID=2943436 RepID=UPI002445C6E9|nr:atrial natriuretic peptide receptor 1-like [Paramacrobiotus metropolitanus]
MTFAGKGETSHQNGIYPLFTSVAGDTRLVNKNRYSTTSAIASLSGPDVITTIYKLFERFRWRTITLICDELKQSPGLSNFFVIQCGDARRMLADRGYTWYFRQINTAEEQRFHDYLTEFKDRCRVFIFLTLPTFLRKIMLAASELGLTQGDYVFVTLQPTTRPGISPITWMTAPDGNRSYNNISREDEIIFRAYQNLIVLTGVNPDWNAITNLTDEIASKKRKLFDQYTPAGDERNELQICIYESTMMFAQIYNENYPQDLTMAKPEFISKTFNRTFNFAARNFSTDKNGAMINYIVVLRLDPVSKLFMTAMIYNPMVEAFTNVNYSLWYWVNRNDTPPDKPPCGFAHNECSYTEAESAMTKGVAAAFALAVVTIGTAGVILLIKRQRDLADLWWYIEPGALTYPANKAHIQRIESFTAVEDGIVGLRMHYRYQNVYATILSMNNGQGIPLSRHRKLLAYLYNLRHIAHENIAPLVGISQIEHTVILVSEYGSKGTLRHLLSMGEFRMDPKLHCSLCWDLFEGVEYLQKTVFGGHGNLSSFLCSVNSRFSLKICQTGYDKIYEILNAVKEVHDAGHLEAVQSLWKPVEFIRLKGQSAYFRQTLKDIRDTDIFAMAMIIYEIITHKLPHNIEDFSFDVVKVTSAKVIYEGNFRITEEELLVAFPLRHLLNSCFSSLTENRPNTKVFRAKLQKIMIKPKPYFEQIARDLESHSRRLEEAVRDRTLELLDEIEKADLLLQELLPLPLVKQLRNKELVAPEYYDGVTVLFSDLPEFAQVGLQCTPMEVIGFLNTIYSTFDEVIPQFDVYKLETINDSYVITSGAPVRNGSEHAVVICNLALELIKTSRKIHSPLDADRPVESRIGVNTGPVVAGIVGKKMPHYCLFGDTINICSRMGSLGEEGKIHLSETTSAMIMHRKDFFVIPRGEIYVKGKGVMNTFWLTK